MEGKRGEREEGREELVKWDGGEKRGRRRREGRVSKDLRVNEV